LEIIKVSQPDAIQQGVVMPHLWEALNSCKEVVPLNLVVLPVIGRDVVYLELDEQITVLWEVLRCGTHRIPPHL
jgi:hypothetical protein